MLPAFASLDDLDDRVPGGIPAGDEARAQAALDDGSSKVRAAAGKTYVDPDTNELLPDVPDIMATVTLAVAKRAFVNPDGYKSESEDIDGYRHAWAKASAEAGAELTDAEIAQVRAAAGRRSGGSARLGRPHRLPTAALVSARNRATDDPTAGVFR